MKDRNPASSRAELRTRDLSPARQRFVRFCQEIWFGKVLNLPVVSAEPVLGPQPRAIRRRKNTAVDSPRSPSAHDYALKHEWAMFFENLDSIRNGVILHVEVAHGLPIIHEYEDVIDV